METPKIEYNPNVGLDEQGAAIWTIAYVRDPVLVRYAKQIKQIEGSTANRS